MERKTKICLWGSILIIVVGLILWFNWAELTKGNVRFAVAQSGTINHELTVAATFANLESPIPAPLSGTIQFVGEDGLRVRRGESIATIQPEAAAPIQNQAISQMLSAPEGGLFFRQSDGLETIMTSQNMNSMDLSQLMTQASVVKSAGATVQTGEIIGKIVSNLVPTTAFVEINSVEGLTTGKKLRFKVGDQTLSATILRKSESPLGVVVQFPNYIDGSATKRRQELTWIAQGPTTGVLVPISALFTQGEEIGIFLGIEGVVHFKKAKILDQDDRYACIEDIPNGIPVVINPRDGLEGLVADVKNL